jgi:ABC-2 type transport system permease protein
MSEARSIWLVARRELVERARSKAFLVSSVLTVVLVSGLAVVPGLLGALESGPTEIAVAGEGSEQAAEALDAAAESAALELDLSQAASPRAAEDAVASQEVEAAFIDGEQLVVRERADEAQAAVANAAARQLRLARGLSSAGLTQGEVAELTSRQPIEVTALSPESEQAEFETYSIGFAGVLLLFFGLLFYGQWVLTGMIEEKTNRTVEVLLSTLRPRQLLAGKGFGIGVLGAGQIVLVAIVVGGLRLATGADLPATAPATAAHIVVWFVLGFGLYSIAFATAGSLCSKIEDAQTVGTPVNLGVIVAYAIGLFTILPDVGSQLAARIATYIPPLTPIVVPARASTGQLPLWEAVIAGLLMVAAIYASIRVGGRIYEGALLRTGERVKLRAALQSAGG